LPSKEKFPQALVGMKEIRPGPLLGNCAHCKSYSRANKKQKSTFVPRRKVFGKLRFQAEDGGLKWMELIA